MSESHAFTRSEVRIPRGQESLGAWHYAPATSPLRSSNLSPVVVMGHGYSLTRDCGLQTYAERFAAAGMHVLVFDYLNFGTSGGTDREVVSAKSQVGDYLAAIAAGRALAGVDPDRVAVWGTSYSGGLAIAAAALDGRVRAVVSQVPNLDNWATLRFLFANNSLRRFLWLLLYVFRDSLRGIMRREPLYVRSVGQPGDRAAYESVESWGQVEQIAGPTWTNRVALRDFAVVPMFRAIKYLDDLPCRVQFFACELDDLTPVSPTLNAARELGDQAELHRYPTGHFGIYVEPALSHALESQTGFLCRELAPG